MVHDSINNNKKMAPALSIPTFGAFALLLESIFSAWNPKSEANSVMCVLVCVTKRERALTTIKRKNQI
jgi:hypothetical protein